MFESGLASLITYNPWSISAKTPLGEVVRMFNHSDFHHWPVVDSQHRLLGIVSDVDIVRAMQQRHTAVETMAGNGAGPGDWSHCTIEQIMSRQVITVDHRDSPKKGLRLLIDHRIHSLPVLEDARLIGILTTTDFLRECSYGHWPMSHDSVAEHMTNAAELIDVQASLDEANDMFQRADSDYLCVVEGDFPLGVISRRDTSSAICRQNACDMLDDDGVKAGPTTIAEVVHQAPIIQPGHSMCEAVTTMLDTHKQAVAVVNRANRLLGILAEDNILRAMLYTNTSR